jgi:hypothetical protein
MDVARLVSGKLSLRTESPEVLNKRRLSRAVVSGKLMARR